jgi:hypothetical protein
MEASIRGNYLEEAAMKDIIVVTQYNGNNRKLRQIATSKFVLN